MGSGGSNDIRKSYSNLPLIVDEFQKDSDLTTASFQNKFKKGSSLRYNENYSLDQRAKLLSQVTLNEFEFKDSKVPLSDSPDMGVRNTLDIRKSITEDSDEHNSSDSFKMNIEMDSREERKNYGKLNYSDMYNKSDTDDHMARHLRAGSFRSLQAYNEQNSESNLNDSNHEQIYLNYPREKMTGDAYVPAPRYGRKLSAASKLNYQDDEESEDIEANIENFRQPQAIRPRLVTSTKEIENFFDAPNRLVRVTSLEISAPRPDINPAEILEEAKETPNSDEKRERDEIIEMRKKFLEQKKKERKDKIKEDTLYKYNRDDMIEKVSKIIHQHIAFSEEHIPEASQGATLFDEKIYKQERWLVHTPHGFSSTLPIFMYYLEKIEYKEKECTPEDINKFIKRIFCDLQLAIECVLIMLIYIERLMTLGGVEIRNMNWKPIVFMGTLLASKFWEDLNFWNVDFIGVGQDYTLEGINQLESIFLSLCQYNLFVSASLYARYYFAVRDKFISSYSRSPQHKENLRKFKLDKFKLRQSRAGYDNEVQTHFKRYSEK